MANEIASRIKDTAPRRLLDRSHFPRLTRRGKEAREMRALGRGIEQRVTRLFKLQAYQPHPDFVITEVDNPQGVGFTSTLQRSLRDPRTDDIVNFITIAGFTQGSDGSKTYTFYDNFGYSFIEAKALKEEEQRRISVTRYKDGSISIAGGTGDAVKDYQKMTNDEKFILRGATNTVMF